MPPRRPGSIAVYLENFDLVKGARGCCRDCNFTNGDTTQYLFAPTVSNEYECALACLDAAFCKTFEYYTVPGKCELKEVIIFETSSDKQNTCTCRRMITRAVPPSVGGCDNPTTETPTAQLSTTSPTKSQTSNPTMCPTNPSII